MASVHRFLGGAPQRFCKLSNFCNEERVLFMKGTELLQVPGFCVLLRHHSRSREAVQRHKMGGLKASLLPSRKLNEAWQYPFLNSTNGNTFYLPSCKMSNRSTALLQLPVFLQAERNIESPAIIDRDGRLKYGDILHHSMTLAVEILQFFSANKTMKLEGERIALLTEPIATYVIGLYSTWICNGISVPLHTSHPASEWEYFLTDSQCSLILVSEALEKKIRPVAEKLDITVKVISREAFGEPYEKNRWFQADHASNPK